MAVVAEEVIVEVADVLIINRPSMVDRIGEDNPRTSMRTLIINQWIIQTRTNTVLHREGKFDNLSNRPNNYASILH